MKQEETSRKQKEHAEETVRQLQAKLEAAKKGERAAARKHENHHKYMMGGVVHKYFPECYEFNEAEMNEIISCAFGYQAVKGLIQRKISEKERSRNADSAKSESENSQKEKTSGPTVQEPADTERNGMQKESTAQNTGMIFNRNE